MAVLETLTFGLATSLARALLKSWVGADALASAATDEIADLLRAAGLNMLERRRVARELDELTDSLAERLEPFFTAEQRNGLPPNEAEAAAAAVARTIELGFKSPAVAFESDLKPENLEICLRQADPDATRDLVPLAGRLYDIALTECAAYLVSMVGNLPDFDTRATAELLSRNRELFHRLTEALQNVPAADAKRAADFETRYRRAVARELETVELYGVSLSERSKRYALSVAYVTLRADITRMATPRSAAESLMAVDRLVNIAPRLMIRGPAGSGKTTLLQWLAVRTAKDDAEDWLRHLRGKVPFLIRLRRYADGQLPLPPQFIDELGSVLGGLMPERWVEQQLDSGRAIVLIDGVDELPKGRRAEAAKWLRSLTDAYPGARYVVTSRLTDPRHGWHTPTEFTESELEPMTLTDVGNFIGNWHAAVARDATMGRERDELKRLDNDLRLAVRLSAPLRRLATNPLLCAVICGIHRDSRAQLPEERVELYELALTALLDARDRERRVTTDDLRIPLKKKRALLEELAYWLATNGYTEVPRDLAVRQLGLLLGPMNLALDPEAVFEYLLERTGLLTEPIVGHVDFVHRTFLEYLAASYAVRTNNLGVVVQRASDDSWGEIVVLTAGLAADDEAGRLVESLLDQAQRDGRGGERMQLLAAAAADAATQLAPKLRSEVTDRLKALVPPTTAEAASRLADAGDLAVPLLAPQGRQREEEARASVRALGMIGSDAALDLLELFGGDSRPSVMAELINQWDNFDRYAYARRVLADSPLDDGALTVVDRDDLSALKPLRHLTRLSVELNNKWCDSASISVCSAVEDLVLSRPNGLTEVAQLLPSKNLRRLWIYDALALHTLSGLEELSLEELHIHHAPLLTTVRPLGEMRTRLQKLSLTGVYISDLTPLTAHGDLIELQLGSPELHYFDALNQLPALHSLTVCDTQDGLDLRRAALPQLRSLTLRACEGDIILGRIGAASAGLDHLALVACPTVVPLEQLGPVANFQVRESPMRDLEELPTRVTTLDLNACESLTTLTGVEQVESLCEVRISACPNLTDLTPLKRCARLRLLALDDSLDPEHLYPLADLAPSVTVVAPEVVLERIQALGRDDLDLVPADDTPAPARQRLMLG